MITKHKDTFQYILNFLTTKEQACLRRVNKALKNVIDEYQEMRLKALTSYTRPLCTTALQLADIELAFKKDMEQLSQLAKASCHNADMIVKTPNLFKLFSAEQQINLKNQAKSAPSFQIKKIEHREAKNKCTII